MNTVFDNAVVCRLRVKLPGQTKKDTRATEAAASGVKADVRRIASIKSLFTKGSLTECTGAASSMRASIRDLCVPWDAVREEDGQKKQDATWVCVGANIEALMEANRENRERFEVGRDALVSRLSDEREAARRELGDAFDEDDYPEPDEFVKQFLWQFDIEPLVSVASPSDWRMKLPKDAADAAMDHYARTTGARVHNVVSDLWSRIEERVIGDPTAKPGTKNAAKEGLLSRLDRYTPDPEDKRKGNSYRDASLYGGMVAIRDMGRAVSEVFDDPALKDFVQKMDAFVDTILPEDPAVVREDDDARARVVQGLTALAERRDPAAVVDAPKKKGGPAQFL